MEDCAGYSIEEHGDGYVLYYGRDNDHHGFNLCKLSEFDSNGENIRSAIVKALNLLKDSQNETKNIKDIRSNSTFYDEDPKEGWCREDEREWGS